MADLITRPNLGDTDDFYSALLAAHEGLDAAGTHRLNARLVLILANHIGDRQALDEALSRARGASGTVAPADPTRA